jgi:hypothetical protein
MIHNFLFLFLGGMWRGVKGDSYIGEWKFGKADGYGVHKWINSKKNNFLIN